MDSKVKAAAKAALKQFSRVSRHDTADFETKVLAAFESKGGFMDKTSALDAAFDDEPKLEELREVFFDLLMINFFAEDVKKLEEDYLESPEWEDIEEKTIDRGTELLNLLLYLKECEDEEIDPELEDYLKEFLLVDEDEFQDEHRIYEDVIANQILVESSVEEIAKAANKLPDSSELKELFYPMMSFFYEQNPSQQQIESYISNSKQPEFDAAVYALLTNYNQP
ncbi:MAG: hypothetical protein K0S09_87 [Sphingobacteriaceae bacterium]|jgi:hypothetical protein|nr:hypothetical protein [Sphingobacteriaceae bacterium]